MDATPCVIESHIVPEAAPRQRLSDYLCGVFVQLPSRNSVKKAIGKGLIRLEGHRGYTGDWVLPGQHIELLEMTTKKPRRWFKLSLEILYEDDHLAVVVKPAGYPVSGKSFQTIENALPLNLQPSTAPDIASQPRVVHRLDVPTSGLLLVAKTKSARAHLGAQFEAKTIQKRYQALVRGIPPTMGSINTPIDEKVAYTSYQRLRTVPSLRNQQISLMNLYPKTGRTHQLRRHLAELGCPIIGDDLYGEKGNVLKGKGLFLRAVELHFEHPETGLRQLHQLPIPSKFVKFLDREQQRYERHQSSPQE